MNSGAYRITLALKKNAYASVGRLGRHYFRAGTYVYIGSARRGLQQRVARHIRLITEKRGKRHWHIDALLLHPQSKLVKTELIEAGDECLLSQQLATEEGVTAPLQGFGASDCDSGCEAHLYYLA